MLFRDLLVSDRFMLPYFVKDGQHTPTYVKTGYDGGVLVNHMTAAREPLGSETFVALEPTQEVRMPFSAYVADGKAANLGRSAWSA